VTRATGEVWESVASNPDPRDDLGYELRALDVISVGLDDEQCMILPSDADHLTEDEFIVASPNAIADLQENR
jgi:hypothetical protein